MRSLKKLLFVLLVLALGGAVTFLLSQLNARTYSVQVVDGSLVVMKGRMLPIGAEPYRPADPVLREAYAPVSLDGTSPGNLPEQRFTEREELDRALFEVVGHLARARVTADDPKVLEQGLYYLRRVEKLSGLSDEQRQSVRDMQSDVAYYLARSMIEQARTEVAEALAQLKLAATTRNRHAHSANQMILELEPAAKAFEEALRKAAHGLSGPAEGESGRSEPRNPPSVGAPELKPTESSPAPSKP
jgi:uncharacterized membrane protein